MVVNGALDIRDKAQISQTRKYVSLVDFFSVGTGQPANFVLDVRTIYDPFEQRFIVLGLDRDTVRANYTIFMAVSKTSDPLIGGWNFLAAAGLVPYQV